MRPPHCCGFHVARNIIAANHIENDINPRTLGKIAACVNKIVAFIIHRQIGTQITAGRAFIVRTSRDDDFGPSMLGHLNGCGADAAGTAMHQKRFAFLQTAALKNIGKDGENSLPVKRLHR